MKSMTSIKTYNNVDNFDSDEKIINLSVLKEKQAARNAKKPHHNKIIQSH
jgi:hypothetical protein